MKENKKEIVKYGLALKSTGELLKYDVYAVPDAVYSTDSVHELDPSGDKDWLVDTFKDAQYVKFNPMPRYNAYYETPYHKYDVTELEVVKRKLIIEDEIIKSKKVIELKYVKGDTRINYVREDNHKGGYFNKHAFDGKKIIALDSSELYYEIVSIENTHLSSVGRYLCKKEDFELVKVLSE